jgi:hypothetical protein
VPLAGARFTPLDDEPTSPSRLTRTPSETSRIDGSHLDSHLDSIGLYERRKTLARLSAASSGSNSEGGGDVAGLERPLEQLAAMEEQEAEAASMCAWLPDFAAELLTRLVHGAP